MSELTDDDLAEIAALLLWMSQTSDKPSQERAMVMIQKLQREFVKRG